MVSDAKLDEVIVKAGQASGEERKTVSGSVPYRERRDHCRCADVSYGGLSRISPRLNFTPHPPIASCNCRR